MGKVFMRDTANFSKCNIHMLLVYFLIFKITTSKERIVNSGKVIDCVHTKDNGGV